MKKSNILLILFLFSFSCFSQNVIQVRLLNSEVVTQPDGQCLSSLPALNAIFSNYSLGCSDGTGGTYIFSDEEPYLIVRLVSFSNPLNQTQIQQIINDLNQIPQVINASVEQLEDQVNFNLEFVLVNDLIGNYVETIDGIVQTSSPELNAIFQTYNVNKQESTDFSSLNLNDLQRIRCNCNVSELKNAMLNLPSIIADVYGVGIAYLNNPDFSISKTIIYPNPFSESFTINTNETISNYVLVDLSGKEIIATSSKQKLDNTSEKLNTGIYLLKLIFDDGKIANYKLVKN